ncbi:MAG: tyrosine/phenylalanine carboxypeptidase domain-containing protein, partial [Acidimicrobiales bacterium]
MEDGTDRPGAAIQADLRDDMDACGADAARQVRDQGHATVAVPGGGLHVDHPLPFLCVYRRPIGGAPAGAERLVLGQAAHLVVSGAPDLGPAVRSLIERLALAVEDLEAFGAFLVVEVWVGERGTPVRVLSPPEGSSTATALVEALGRVEGMGIPDLVDDPAPAPPGYAPVLEHDAARRLGALILGVEVPPVFVDAGGGVLPLVLQRYQDELTAALRQAVFEFATVQTTLQPEHVGSLGPRRLADPVTEVDRALTELATLTDPLLALTPVDADAAWEQFRTDRFEQVPHFHYRPLTLDPDLVKRALYELPVEEVEDPTLAGLFREKRHELDAELDL